MTAQEKFFQRELAIRDKKVDELKERNQNLILFIETIAKAVRVAAILADEKDFDIIYNDIKEYLNPKT